MIAIALEKYFLSNARVFPWRAEQSAYRIALAEMLLQKTRAESAVPVYYKLISAFPDVSDLANASLEELERLLYPLGLSKKRATKLKALALELLRCGVDALADWKRTLSDFPGFGEYGARAVACFGFNIQIGIVDANVARILRRVFSLKQSDPRAKIFQRLADGIALKSRSAHASNYALLDIGAIFCKSKPKCEHCPLNRICDTGRSRAQ